MASRSNREDRPSKPRGPWGAAYGGSRGGMGGRKSPPKIRPQPSIDMRGDQVDPATGAVINEEPPARPGEVARGAPAPTARRGGRYGKPMFDAEGVAAGAAGGQPSRRRGIAGMVGEQVGRARERQAELDEAERAAKYPTTSPGIGETAYRPGYTDEDARRARYSGMTRRERKQAKREEVRSAIADKFGKKKKRGGFLSRAMQEIQDRQAANQPERQEFDPMLGVKESLGAAYVEPGSERGPGGNESAQPSRRRSRRRGFER